MDLVQALVSVVILGMDKPGELLAGSRHEDGVEPLAAIVVPGSGPQVSRVGKI